MHRASSTSVRHDDNGNVEGGGGEGDCGRRPAGWFILKRLQSHRLHRSAVSMFGAKQRAQIFIGFSLWAMSGPCFCGFHTHTDGLIMQVNTRRSTDWIKFNRLIRLTRRYGGHGEENFKFQRKMRQILMGRMRLMCGCRVFSHFETSRLDPLGLTKQSR